MVRKQFPRKLLMKKLAKRERYKRNRMPKKKRNKDILYEKTKKLAKKMGVRFLMDHETFKDIRSDNGDRRR